MNSPKIAKLEEILKRYPAPRPELESACGSTHVPGQVWRVRPFYAESSFHDVLILGCHVSAERIEVLDVAPLVHDATFAGPEDYILPERVFCHHTAVMLSLVFSLPMNELGTCLGFVGNDLVGKISAHNEKVQDGSLMTGEYHMPDYFDEKDFRYRFHEQAAEQITELQSEIYSWLNHLESPTEAALFGKQPIIDLTAMFGRRDNLALAAADSGLPDDGLRSFRYISEDETVKITISEMLEKGGCALEVNIDREDRLDYGKVVSESGKQVAVIKDGVAHFKMTGETDHSIYIVDSSDKEIELKKDE